MYKKEYHEEIKKSAAPKKCMTGKWTNIHHNWYNILKGWQLESLKVLFYEVKVPTSDGYITI